MNKESLIRYAACTLRFSGVDKVLRSITQPLGGILMLHRIADKKPSEFDPNGILSVTPDFFDEMCAWLKASQFDIIGMDEVPDRLANADKSKPFLALTFDDGYLDNLELALPILEKHNLPFTIYSSSGLSKGTSALWWQGIEWALENTDNCAFDFGAGLQELPTQTAAQKQAVFDRIMHYVTNTLCEDEQRQAVKELCKRYEVNLEERSSSMMMSDAQIAQISKHDLCTIGAHSVGHYSLGRLPIERVKQEIAQDVQALQEIIGYQPRHFAYPYGNPIAATVREFELAQQMGFSTAVTTRKGALFDSHKEHMTALPRLSVNGNFQDLGFFKTWVGGMPAFAFNKLRKINVS